MKKIISIILVISLLATLSVNVFAARDIDSFETLFQNQLPTYLFNDTEFEAGGEYILYVYAPSNQDDRFQADGGTFEGVIARIDKDGAFDASREEIVCNNAEIITIEEDENFNYIITFMPTNEGEFSFEFTMRIFGYDITKADDYRFISGDEWTYTFATEPFVAGPSTKPTFTPGSSTGTTSSVTSNVQNTSSVVDVNLDDTGVSVWVWVVVGLVAAAACAVVVIFISKKKLVK